MERSTDNKFCLLQSIDRACERCKFKKALAQCNRALSFFEGDSELLRRKGMIINILGDHEGAREIFSRLIEIDEKKAENYYGLGLVHYFEKEFSQARENLEKAVELFPTFHQANSLLAEAFVQLEMFNAAEQLVAKQLLQYRQDSNQDLIKAMLLCTRAQIELKRNQPEAARQTLLEANVLDGNNPRVLSALRRFNPEASVNSKLYLITVEGQGSCGIFSSHRTVTYCGSFEVIADSKEEALGYIQKIESIATPESLQVVNAKSKSINAAEQRKGITHVFPSCSIETVDEGVVGDKFIEPKMGGVTMVH